MLRRAALLSLATSARPASTLAAPRTQAPEPRILGTWRSDRARTLAFRAAGRLVTDAQRAAMAQLFRQMVHVITPTTFTMIPQAGVVPIRSRCRVAARTPAAPRPSPQPEARDRPTAPREE